MQGHQVEAIVKVQVKDNEGLGKNVLAVMMFRR